MANAQDTGTTPPVMPNIQETPLPPPVTLPAAQPPADVPNRPLNATEAAQVALRHQPDVTVAQAGLAAAQGRTQQSRSFLYPRLGISAGYDRTTQIARSGGSGSTGSGGSISSNSVGSSYSASATLSQLIFDFNHTRDQVREAQAAEQAAGANVNRVQLDLVQQVKSAYYTYVQDQRLVAVNEDNVRNQQAHLALARARLEAGLGLPSDVVRAQALVADAILNLNLARNASSVAQVNLATLMGIDPRTPIVTTDTGEPEVTATDVNALVATGQRQRPEIVQAQATVRSYQAAVSAARTYNAPSISANLGANTRGGDFPPGNDYWSIGASISWTPWDSGYSSGLMREARANLTSAQAQLQSAQLTVTQDVSQSYLDLRTAEQRVVTSDAEVANANEAVRLAEGRYRAGVGTFIDVVDAQSALLTAQTNRVNAQTAVNQARAALQRAIGARF